MWIATCCASCCASCACAGLRGIAGGISRRSARLAYCGIFAMSLLVAWLLREFGGPLLSKIPWIDSGADTPSDDWFATQAVLRVSLGNFLFFLALAILMIGVKDQDDPRDGWHHGGWMFKFVLWIVTIFLMFFLPNVVVNVYGSLARFGSGLFLLVQVLILLDFTHNWNAAWVEKDEQFWYIALLVSSVVCYLGSFVLSGFLFYWFNPAEQNCQLNIFFIVCSLIFGIGFGLISLHPQINGSLLPASALALYCTYLCYSALSSEPWDYACNGLQKHVAAVSTATLLMGLLTTVLSVVYSAVRVGSSTTFLSPPTSPRASGSRKPLLSSKDDDDIHELEGATANQKSKRGEVSHPVTYVYSFFHVIFALASMYSAMLLSGWGNTTQGDEGIIDVGWPSVWVRIATLCFTAGLFVWSLLAPVLFPDREFS